MRRDGLHLGTVRATLQDKRNAATRRGSCERCDRARYGKNIQMGRDPAGSARRRAEGDGEGAVRRRPGDARHAGRPHPAFAARPCAHPFDRCLEGGGAARRQGGGDRRGLPRAEIRLCRPGTRGTELLAHDSQHHGAREGALRRACGRSGRGRQQVDRRPCVVIDRGRLRGAAARHRRRRGDEAGCAPAVRRHAHPRGRTSEGAVEYREAQRVQSRRRQGRLRGGRRNRRDVVQDRAGASGLYRAAGLRRALRRRRPVRAVEREPGPLRRPQLHRDSCST